MFNKSLEKLCDCVQDLAAVVPEVVEAIVDDDATTHSKLTELVETVHECIEKSTTKCVNVSLRYGYPSGT